MKDIETVKINGIEYVPFAEDKDYIRADKWDKWVAVALGIAVLIVVALDSAWLMGWLP